MQLHANITSTTAYAVGPAIFAEMKAVWLQRKEKKMLYKFTNWPKDKTTLLVH